MPDDRPMRQDRDLVLAPQQYAYILDSTKGNVSAFVGPYRTSLSNTDQLVMWTGRKFAPTNDVSQAIHSFVKAAEGQYVVLVDPAQDNPESFPAVGNVSSPAKLDSGKRIVIPGPISFAPWPGQTAMVIDGHHLNLNQYLIAQVYEPEAAEANAERAITAPSTGETVEKAERVVARRFTMGERIVIKGTDVSFYVPPTGIEVVPESGGQFIREAATLEQLEYCVLTAEDGRKRYERGPAVVFPEPTETFIEEKGTRKFRAIELNEQSGLYIKVIAAYAHDGDYDVVASRGGKMVTVKPKGELEEGDELFLTGKDTPIYFPRPEQSVIHYGDTRKHHAIAIPSGEGRYVLDRTTGEVDLITGPRMFLADPRTQVIVRRVLPVGDVQMMYPGNREALAVNQAFQTERDEDGQEFLQVASASAGESGSLATSYAVSTSFAGDKMRRGTRYTPPRTITLDTKYQGAVGVEVWAGYAVLIVDKSGNRRVEIGPKNILLAYDEKLMALTLSTGRPKTDTNPIRDVYLKTVNNAVGDVVVVETRDLVPVALHLSLRVDFEGDNPLKWFDVEDYVALLTDHCRSRLRNVAKRHGIEDFYAKTIDIVRDELLGPKVKDGGERKGLPFSANGMRLFDVEVLGVEIRHPEVAQLLTGTTIRAIQGAIQLTEAEENALREKKLLALEKAQLEERELMAERRSEAAVAATQRALTESQERLAARQAEEAEETRLAEMRLTRERAAADQARELTQALDSVQLARLEGEVAQFAERMKAVSPGVIEALNVFGQRAVTEALVEALGPAALASGANIADMFAQAFGGTELGKVMGALSQRPLAATNGH